VKIINGISLLTVDLGIAIGYMIAVIHNIRNIFDIFDPTIFQIAIAVFHSNALITFTTSSGAEVPKATMVRPITSPLIQNFFAIELAQSTSISAHLIRRTNHIIKITKGKLL
jgi:hypothetical protein